MINRPTPEAVLAHLNEELKVVADLIHEENLNHEREGAFYIGLYDCGKKCMGCPHAKIRVWGFHKRRKRWFLHDCKVPLNREACRRSEDMQRLISEFLWICEKRSRLVDKMKPAYASAQSIFKLLTAEDDYEDA